MQILQFPFKQKPWNYFIIFMAISSFLCTACVITSFFTFSNTSIIHFSTSLNALSSSTSLEHIVFGIASNEQSWKSRKDYVKLWWRSREMRGCVFLDTVPPDASPDQADLPPICLSGDTSRFRYTFRNGLRSAIRVARVVSETIGLNHSNVRWYVFGDDDTVFFPENLVKTLSKYDHRLWYYIGANSESIIQNKIFSYEMAFGGAGFAISYPLAKVLSKVLDSCIDRYPHLYGSDGRIYACLAELGVGLTHEPGFHQMDIRGSMYGFLASHPMRPLVSLHHWDAMDPVFPKMSPVKALQHLFQAVTIDSERIVQQSVCYDRWFSWTISVSWGYAVQIIPRHVFLPDVLRIQETYIPWRKGGGINDAYAVDTTEYDSDPCRRPPVFFLHDVSAKRERITSIYRRMSGENCSFDRASPRKVEEIRVLSTKLNQQQSELEAPRRECCDVLPSSAGNVMEIGIRECGDEELIHMH